MKVIKFLTAWFQIKTMHFTTPIDDKLISPKQLDYFHAKHNESFYNKESFTAIS